MGNVNEKAAEREEDDRSSEDVIVAIDRDTPTDRIGSIAMVALVIGIAVVSGAIGAVAVANRSSPPPKILVLDMASLLEPIANDPALDAYEKRRLTENLGAAVNRAMQIEASNGAIILDASLVLTAPGESYVQP